MQCIFSKGGYKHYGLVLIDQKTMLDRENANNSKTVPYRAKVAITFWLITFEPFNRSRWNLAQSITVTNLIDSVDHSQSWNSFAHNCLLICHLLIVSNHFHIGLLPLWSSTIGISRNFDTVLNKRGSHRSGVLDFNFLQLKADIGHTKCSNFAVYAHMSTFDTPIDSAWCPVLGLLQILKIGW